MELEEAEDGANAASRRSSLRIVECGERRGDFFSGHELVSALDDTYVNCRFKATMAGRSGPT